MALWLLRHLKRQGFSPQDLRAAASVIGRHTLIMGIVYAVTLGIALAVAALVTM
jgi:hypothetical protein